MNNQNLYVENNNIFRVSFEQAEVGLAHVSLNGCFLRVNNRLCEILGFSNEELNNMTFRDITHPEDMAYSDEMFEKMKNRTERFIKKDKRYFKKDGSMIWVNLRSTLIFDEKGEPDFFLSVIVDITERKKAEYALRESEARYRGLFDAMIEGVAMHRILYDENGTACNYEIIDINPAYKKQTGLGPEDVIGHKVSEIYGVNLPPYFDIFQKVVNTGKPEFFESYFEPLKKHFAISVFSQSKGHFTTIFDDITIRKQADESLFDEKERLRITLQSIGDAVIATDNNGIVTIINTIAEQLTGWKASDAIGMHLSSIFDIYNEITEEKCENPVTKVLETGKTIELSNHTIIKSKDGNICPIADSAAPIVNTNDEIIGVVLVFRDVSSDKKKETEIKYLSYHDGLTGLYNRVFFEQEARRLESAKVLPVSVIMGDLNGLKLINDVFGHSEGDKLLTSISTILLQVCENHGIVSRYGGDEFCIILKDADEQTVQRSMRVINRLCIEYNDILADGKAPLSISMGCSTKNNLDENILQLVKAAEDSMYKHKLLESRSHHNSIIASIRATLFEKSYETEMHAERMIEYSRAIGRSLNLSADLLNDLALFAMLHDIGKIGVSDAILTKPGRLTDDEWIEMRRHPEIGYRIVQASPDLIHIADYILTHHERYDGNGYPQGMKGEEIPLLSRILAIVDAYDVMTQGRVYKGAMSKEDALIEIVKNSGTQFDPDIVKVFLHNI